MMRKIYFLLVTLFFLQSISAQFVILDEAPQNSQGVFNDLVVYDNDIIYIKSIDGNTYTPRVFLNYGVPNKPIEINSGQNQALRLKQQVSDFLLRQFYNGGYYENGTKIFGQQIPNGTVNTENVLELNKSRTLFLPNSFGLKSVDQAGNHTLVGRDTITNVANPYYTIKIVQENLVKSVKIPESFYANNGTFGGFFTHNNTVHFSGTLDGRNELYVDNGFGEANQITNLSSGTSGTGILYPLTTSNGIWFNGLNIISTGSGTQNKGRELCFTNGSTSLNEPPALGFGYIPYETGIINANSGYNGSTPVIFGEVNGNIIYYAQNTGMRKFYSHPGNLDLGMPSYVFTDNGSTSFAKLNNKLYIAYRINSFSSTSYKIYVVDGKPANTQVVDIPFATGISQLMVYNNAIYYVANKSLHKLNPTTLNVEILFEAPNGILQLTPYQNGFVFISGKKLMGWNIEARQAIYEPNSSKTNSKTQNNINYQLSYNSKNYDISLNSVSFTTADKLKIQLLEDNSSQKQFVIKNFTQKEGELNASIFYAINTFSDGNSHTSNISFTYNKAMFASITNFDASKLKVYKWQNNSSEEIPAVLNLTSQTLTVNTSFEDQTFIYFSYSDANLGVNENQLKEVTIYPNPASKTVNIKSINSEIQQIEIYNLQGKRVLKLINFKAKNQIDVSNLSKGMYILKAKSDGKMFSKKLIIK